MAYPLISHFKKKLTAYLRPGFFPELTDSCQSQHLLVYFAVPH